MRKLFWVMTALACGLAAQSVNPAEFSGLHWRLVGPFRAGRIAAVAGIAGDPATYYVGNPGGGVFKTTTGGTVWQPIFDHEPVDSIGAIAVAPSNPNIVYVGTGDVDNVGGSVDQGDGMWRSDDAGRTWQHIGLDDSRHIGAILVDPHDPNLVLVAAKGHTFAPSPERGVYRSTDGGVHWTHVLDRGPDAGAVNIAWDARHPQLVFAGLEGGQGAGVYRSQDEGATWSAVTGSGLPDGNLGRIGLAVSGPRVFAITTQGLFRSDDSGATWTRATDDRRVMGSSYFSEVYIAPNNPDTVYVCQTSLYRSTDGGKTFVAFKGAPGGDDYHEMWIDPTNPKRMILGVDQGPTISLDGGLHWSLDWYEFPNAQFYHIATDNRFPYWIYGTQQDSGSAAMASFGDFGETTFMDWRPSVGAYEFGYIQPDMQDPNFIYATGGGAALNRYNWRTKQIYDISPPPVVDGVQLRWAGSPQAQVPGTLYLGAQVVLATHDRGLTWHAVSGDLTGGATNGRGPAISALASDGSWAGTSDGRIAARAGAQWVPAGQLQASIEAIEAALKNPAEAYAVIERHTQNDFTPYIYRTRDRGAHWTKIADGIPQGDLVRVVRADPKQPGLLYAGTEWGVYVSFNDGDQWQPLQLDLPRSSVRDLRVHGDDLIAATYGRAVWILDDVTPLRQLAQHPRLDTATLFRPATAVRMQPDVNYDTPFPPEMPTGENPPAGAVIDYYLPQAATGEITLGIYDAHGALIRSLTSQAPAPEPPPMLDIPNYWLAQPHPLPTTAGMHRVVWDLRYTPPPSFSHTQPIAALVHDTPSDPRGPFVTAGDYELRLAVNGATLRQPLHVTMDPRITTTAAGLTAQRDLALAIAHLMQVSYDAGLHTPAPARGRGRGAGRRGGRGAPPSARSLNQQLGNLLTLIELSDDTPTAAMRGNYAAACAALQHLLPSAGLACNP